MRELGGVSATIATRQLLAAAGVTSTAARPRLATLRDGIDEELILGQLRAEGVDARLVKLAQGDLRWLRMPAAIRLDDGSWLVLRRVPLLGRKRIEARADGVAIEVLPALDLAHPFRFAALHAGPLTQIVIAAMLLQLLGAAIPLLTRYTADVALPHGATSLLTAMSVALSIAALFAGATAWLRGIALVQLKAVFDVASGRAFLQHFFRLPFQLVQRRGVGESMQAMSGMQMARDVVLERVIHALLDLLGIAIYGAMLLLLFPAGAIVVAAGSLVVLLVALLSATRQAHLQRDELVQQTRQRSFLFEALAGIGTVKASGAEERTGRQWLSVFGGEAMLAMRRMRAALWLDVTSDVARNGVIAIVLISGGLRAINGAFTLGGLLALLQLSTALLVSVNGAALAVVAIATTRQQLAKTREMLQLPIETPHRIVRGRAAPRVMLDDVWFRHDPRGPWILQRCSLVLEPGTIHHLDGPSGSGKTTLLRLIAGLYAPDRGIIRVGGVDPRVAGSFAYLPQFPHLFAGTIATNLRIFSGGAAMSELQRAAAETGLDAWVRSLPMGYETRVPGGGLSFSGGQRQLITLTAVLAAERPLLLLDEPMANLGEGTRAHLWRFIARAERTVIHASHDGPALHSFSAG